MSVSIANSLFINKGFTDGIELNYTIIASINKDVLIVTRLPRILGHIAMLPFQNKVCLVPLVPLKRAAITKIEVQTDPTFDKKKVLPNTQKK